MNKELLHKLQHKKEANRGWKQGQAPGRNTEKLSEQPGIRLGKLKS